MGGAVVDLDAKASLEKLFVAGEDAGGVHGANRLGGNGICESCVYGRLAGKALAKDLNHSGYPATTHTRRGQASEMIDVITQPTKRSTGPNPFDLKQSLQALNW